MGRRVQPQHNPVLHRYGAELSRLRGLAEISQRSLARQTGYSPQQVGAIERAERYPSREFSEQADILLDAGGSLIALWKRMFDAAFPRGVGEYLDAEKRASMIRQYHTSLVPGLLQTPEYARTTLTAANPFTTKDEIEQWVISRVKRQSLLDCNTHPAFWVIIDESALLRPVGGSSLMSDQITRIIDNHESRRIRLQITPFSAAHPPGLTGPFLILSFPDQADVVYVETVAKGEMVSEPEVVESVTQLFSTLQSAALSPEQSVERLHEIQKEFNGR
ncbi:helix-turn-helix domain-containing protein [Nocardiopsis chromatogenes]|uniref:helix-turn-helix domain-containing protein n=1 Tax=Nocardiopsis chromatogenes TaxID=280239 RepID=UPI0012696925|nr:helix-turn-helix transcriptional regulator [Nocardiopsis chromatogenes]